MLFYISVTPNLNGSKIQSTIVQFHGSIVDGDGISIPLRVDSTLSYAANMLNPGSIALIKSFIPIHF
ncbi:hypothetical protein ACHAWF_005434 [Thalassiosira exigua]